MMMSDTSEMSDAIEMDDASETSVDSDARAQSPDGEDDPNSITLVFLTWDAQAPPDSVFDVPSKCTCS